MEDEEEINNNNGNGCQQPLRDDAGEGGLGIEETPTPTPVEQPEVVSNDNITEQCEFFSDPLPEFDDPVVSSISEASMTGAEMQIQVEDMLDPEMDDFPSPICGDDVGAEGGGDDVGDTSALELADSLIVRENSPKDGESAGAEDAVVAEREVAAEGIVVTGSSGPRDDSQLAGLNLPDISKDDEAGTEKQASTPLQEEGVKHAGSDEGIAGNENLIESQNGVGAESSVKEDHYEAEGKQGGTEDTNMDMQTEVANQVEAEKNSSPRVVDDSNDVDVDSPMGPRDDDDDDGDGEVVAEDVPIGDTEMETETDGTETADVGNGTGGGGKRKRGKVSKVPARNPARKVTEEDVCFICFDGGELVLCDRRGCPKAYHPSCVNRDESFFRAKGRWNCGWHLCSTCEKNAHYMCYTCTFSLCKACIKDAVILCVRGNKGFCETCMKTVMEIETNEQANKEGGVDYDDKSSWMYLFKDYWMDLKAKLSLSVDELAQARNPWKGSDVLVGKQELADDVPINDDGSGSDSSENLKVIKPKRRISKKRAKTVAKEYDVPGSATKMAAEGNSGSGRTEWASKELLEFVSHMKNGDKSVLSQFEVQALLLQYINTNNLRDPRRKSQIICDGRLQNIFAKARVGHFEMLKLLESHFLVKDDSQIDDVQGTAVDTEANQLEPDGTSDTPVKGGKEKRRKKRKKSYERGRQSNLDDYAAIDVHNIGLIYLRRKLMEDLLDDLEKCDNVIDPEKFCDKVIGTFVRIRISGSNQKQDIYRLVQIAGTSRAGEPYKVGKKTTDIVLEILNLNKTEVVSIDTISNQEFTEDECKRLRQSIKCGLINRLTVGDVLDKALGLQAVRVKDWLESETVRLSHLRDRASEKGRKKELRECVEKLQLLKTPNERHRRLEEIPEIHADPKMDPSYESEEADSETEENKQEIFSRPRGSSFGRKGREPVSPRGGNFHSTDSWSGSRRNSLKNWDSNKLVTSQDPGKSTEANLVGDMLNNYAENQVRDRDVQRTTNMEKINVATNTETVGHSSYGFAKSRSSSVAMSEVSHAFPSSGVDDTAFKVNESEKMWHYKDPSGKVQGPFSIVQLRKWNNTGYFPADLKIWKAAEKEDDSVLLTDALAGRFHKKLLQMDTSMTTTQTVQSPHLSSAHGERAYRSTTQQGSEGEGEAGGGRLDLNQNNAGRRPPAEISSSTSWGTPSVEAPKFSADGRSSEYSRNDQINLPSPTPKLSTPDTSGGGQFSRASASVLVNQSGSKEHTAMGSQSPAPSSQIVSSMNAASPLQNSQTNATGESHGMHPHGESHGWGSGSTQRQEIAQNHSHPVPVQQAGYNQWGGIQSPGQNQIGNFPNPGFPATPQSEPWRPPVAVNQPNIQPNLPWGVTVPGANTYTTPPGPRPENANMFWNPMQGNPHMGWGGAAPGTLNMNWMASVAGQVPGWVAAPTANPVGMVHGNVNPGWVPQAVPHPGTVLPGPQPPASGNPAWGPPNGNPGSHNDQVSASVNANLAWGPPLGNQGAANNQGPAPVNANPSWSGPPAANSGSWGNDNQQGGQMDASGGSGGKDFGNRGNRPWNRQSSFGGNGNGGNSNDGNVQRGNWAWCRFHKAGTCRKGKHCRNRHT